MRSSLWTGPTPTGPFLVHHLLTVLRYLRADCHSEVLTEAELTPGEAARLDEVWRALEGTHHGQTLEDLALRGLVTTDGELTDDGRQYPPGDRGRDRLVRRHRLE